MLLIKVKVLKLGQEQEELEVIMHLITIIIIVLLIKVKVLKLGQAQEELEVIMHF